MIRLIGEGKHTPDELIRASVEDIKEHVTSEANRLEEHVTSEAIRFEDSVATRLLAQQERQALAEQRERLRRSLRFSDMRTRRNRLAERDDLALQQVIRSFQTIEDPNTSNGTIDEYWQRFVDWFRSDSNSLFWIQGKPGSGKSTLMHFLTSNDEALNWMKRWRPTSRIISHYFYALGKSPFQTDATGLYSGLLDQLLDGDQTLATNLVEQVPSSARKDFLEDWPVQDLESLLQTALHSQQTGDPLYIFIDGLDEYSGADRPDGLLQRLERIRQHPKVRICVSSRPDQLFLDKLSDFPGFELQRLTEADMRMHAENALAEFKQQQKITEPLAEELATMLVQGAQGVFLWLHLALESIKEGIRGGDDDDSLKQRVSERPAELEEVFATMWKRAYNGPSFSLKSASKFFQLAITAQTMTQQMPPGHRFDIDNDAHGFYDNRPELIHPFTDIGLFEFMCAMKDDMAESGWLGLETPADFKDVEATLQRLENQIRSRCAGLLEVRPRLAENIRRPLGEVPPQILAWERLAQCLKRVEFVHRTARDFLLDGQDVLWQNQMSPMSCTFALLRGMFCRVRFMNQGPTFPYSLSTTLFWLGKLFANDTELYQAKGVEILQLVQDFYEQDLFGIPEMRTKPHFLAALSSQATLDGYSLQRFEGITEETAERVLNDVWRLPRLRYGRHQRPVELVCKLLEKGACPFTVAYVEASRSSLCPLTNALWLLINPFLKSLDSESALDSNIFIEAVGRIIKAYPNLIDHQWLVVANQEGPPFHSSLLLFSYQQHRIRPHHGVKPILQINTKTALNLALRRASVFATPEAQTTCAELCRQCTPTPPRVPYVAILEDKMRWFRILDEGLQQSVVSITYDAADGLRSGFAEQLHELSQWEQSILRLRDDPTVLESVPWKAMVYSFCSTHYPSAMVGRRLPPHDLEG